MAISDAVLSRYRRQLARYRDRTSLALVGAWDALDGHDKDNFDQYVELTAVPLGAGQAAAVSLSSAMFALTLDVPPVGVAATDLDLKPDLWGPFRATWHARKTGRPEPEALAAGRSTAQSSGFDFIQSSARRTGDLVASASGVDVRWQRFTIGTSCEWCHLVAGDHYRTAESADFGHERCDCDAIPVLL